MNYLPLNAVISEALSITPDTDASTWAFARQWAVTALYQLGAASDEIEACRIDVKNLTMIKPKNMRQYIEMALYNSSNQYIPHTFRSGRKRIYPDTRYYPSVVDSNTDQAIHYVPVDVSEDTQAFYLGTNATDVAYAMVRYYAYPLDNDGLPLIREDEKFAIMCYIKWAKSSKKNESQSEQESNWIMWAQQHDRARAMKKKTSQDEAKTVARKWMTMLPIFNSSPY